MADKQLKEDFQALSQLFEHIPQETEVLQTTTYTLNLEKYDKERTIQAKTQLSIAQYEQYVKLKALNEENLKEKEETLKSQLNGFIASLTPQYNLGDKFQEVDGIEAIELEGYTAAPATWKPKEGIVTLIDIWATWCGPCQKPMQHNQEMLEKNENWKGKVEIVGLSVDDELPDVTKRIQDKKWTSINHYRFTKGWDGENFALKAFKLRGIPFVALLDKQGKIVYKGHPSQGKLEETINKLIAEEQAEDANVKEAEQQEKQEQHVLLDKAEFKALKAKVSGEIQEFLKKLELPESEVELVLVKTNQVSAAGKVPQQRTHVKVNYSVPKAHKAKLDEFLTFLNNSLPDKVIIGKAKILDPEGQRNELKVAIQQECQKNGIELSYQDRRQHKFSYAASDEALTYKLDSSTQPVVKKCSVETVATFAAAIKPKLQEIEDEELEEFADTIMNEVSKASQLGVGDTFIQIEGYKKIGSEVETLTHKQGQILVIDYWAQWCGPCRSAMPKNNEILKANKATWGDSVRLVALSLVKEDEVKEYLEQNKNLDEIEFYFPTKEEQPDTKLYGVRYIPHYVIVDKEGKVQHLGSQKNLKEFIENLINPKEVQGAVQQETVTLEQIQKVKSTLELSKDALKGVGDQYTFEFNLTLNALYQSDAADAELVNVEKPSLTYWVRSDKVEQLNKVLSEIFKIIPKEHFKIDETISQTFDVPFPGTECTLCKAVLTDQIPQYYSPFKNEFVCVDCAEFDDKTKVGLAKYKYTDTLIFINAPLTDLSVLKGIDDYKKGKNLSIPEGEAGSQRHDMSCNGCRKGAEGPRYISLTARPGKPRSGGYCDYCSECFAVLKNKNSEEAQKIIAKDKEVGMCTDGIFLRVLFNNGYYDF